MSRKVALLIATVVVFSLISCAPPEPETAEPPPAPVVEAADPTVVDSGHYTAEFENDRVRIVRIAYGPGEESVMHDHPEGVAVYLTDNLVEMTLPDGSTAESPATAGEAEFAPAGQHLPKNISDAALELVLVELKSGGSAASEADGPDAIAVDAGHYTVEGENDSARIVRIAYDAGEE
jgi:quercetin dioxygenase-like cupin family protein